MHPTHFVQSDSSLPLNCPPVVFFTDLCIHSSVELSALGWARVGVRLKTPSGEVWGSNSRNRIRRLPWCAAMHPCATALPVINTEAVAQGDLSANPTACREFWGPGRKGLDRLFSLSHFPFTLFQAPGEYSPSCQCNVAHRGNHAASLASGLPAQRRKCNFST